MRAPRRAAKVSLDRRLQKQLCRPKETDTALAIFRNSPLYRPPSFRVRHRRLACPSDTKGARSGPVSDTRPLLTLQPNSVPWFSHLGQESGQVPVVVDPA